MKLKKIVSLALAGILAVSMLTACGDKGSSSSSNGGDTQVNTTGVVALFQNAVKSRTPDLKINFVDGGALNVISTNDTTKNFTYADLTGSSATDNLNNKVDPLVKAQFASITGTNQLSSVTFANLSTKMEAFATQMVKTTSVDSNTQYGVAFLKDDKDAYAGTSIENVLANKFAEALKAKKVANLYEDIGSEDYTAEYTVTLYTAKKTDSGVKADSGLLVVMVVESEFDTVD